MSSLPDFDVIIPARLGATRLPGKPLLDVAGRPLVVRVADAASRSSAARVVVATDSDSVASVVGDAGYDWIMTPADCPSGTDRIASAVSALELADERIIVNVQGDEPDMPAALIDQVASLLAQNDSAVMATAGVRITEQRDWADPSVVKVVTDMNDRALYFSRAGIPASDSGIPPSALRHIGIYAYRAAYVTRYAAREPSPLELTERLEQLRVLWHGEQIICAEAIEAPGPGVDTPEDLERVRKAFA